MGDQRRHIETDAARPHDRHGAPDRFAAQNRVNIRHGLGVIDAGNVGRARTDAGGDDHLVMASRRQHVSIHTGVEFQRNAQLLDHPAEIAQRFVELLLARHPLGQVELAADFGSGIIDRQLVAALRRFHGKGQPRRPGANHGQIARRGGRHHRHQRFIASARIDQARGELARERVIKAGLVAGDAGVDLVLAAFERLVDQIGIGQHRPRHRNEIGMAGGQHLFRYIRHVDAVRRDHRNAHMLPDAPRHFGKGGARHHGGDGRHLGLMPSEVRADDGGAGSLHGLRQLDHLLARHAAFQHVHGRDAEDQDEIIAHSFAGAADHFDREAHAVFETAAPFISAGVGLFDQKGGEEIASRADDLDAIIARRLRLRGAIGEIIELLLDPVRIQFIGHETADAGSDGRWRHARRCAGERPGMEDLHHDFHIRRSGVNGFGDDAVLRRFLWRRKLAATAGFMVGRDAAGDDHPHAAARPFREEGGHALKPAFNILEAGVHRSHQNAVLQAGEAQVERREGEWVFCVSHDGEAISGRWGRHPSSNVQGPAR